MQTRILISLLLAAMIVISGCDIQTEPDSFQPYPPANHLVINEVFTLPRTDQNTHSWVEIYNPTSRTVDLKNWTIEFRTQRFNTLGLIFRGIDTSGGSFRFVDDRYFQFALPDSVGVYAMPLTQSRARVELKPNEFYLLVSDQNRLEVFVNLGPGPGPSPRSTPLLESLRDTVRIQRDSINRRLETPDSVFSKQYEFLLPRDSCQIVLRDSTGAVVDVVRFGKYAYSGAGSDPYPSNISLGIVPVGESIVRWAGAYSTGNTANDFYPTASGYRPIPMWYSQFYKKQ